MTTAKSSKSRSKSKADSSQDQSTLNSAKEREIQECICGCCHGASSNDHQMAVANGELLSSDDAEILAAFFKALCDPSRLNIVYLLLKHQQLSVGDIAMKTNMSISAVSHQLATLRMRKLVTVKRDGVKNYYGLCDDHVFQVIATAIEHIRED